MSKEYEVSSISYYYPKRVNKILVLDNDFIPLNCIIHSSSTLNRRSDNRKIYSYSKIIEEKSDFLKKLISLRDVIKKLLGDLGSRVQSVSSPISNKEYVVGAGNMYDAATEEYVVSLCVKFKYAAKMFTDYDSYIPAEKLVLVVSTKFIKEDVKFFRNIKRLYIDKLVKEYDIEVVFTTSLDKSCLNNVSFRAPKFKSSEKMLEHYSNINNELRYMINPALKRKDAAEAREKELEEARKAERERDTQKLLTLQASGKFRLKVDILTIPDSMVSDTLRYYEDHKLEPADFISGNYRFDARGRIVAKKVTQAQDFQRRFNIIDDTEDATASPTEPEPVNPEYIAGIDPYTDDRNSSITSVSTTSGTWTFRGTRPIDTDRAIDTNMQQFVDLQNHYRDAMVREAGIPSLIMDVDAVPNLPSVTLESIRQAVGELGITIDRRLENPLTMEEAFRNEVSDGMNHSTIVEDEARAEFDNFLDTVDYDDAEPDEENNTVEEPADSPW